MIYKHRKGINLKFEFLCLDKGGHYTQATLSHLIDIYPASIIDLDRLSTYSQKDKGLLVDRTFINVLRKLCVLDENISDSRILSGLISKSRRYCPKCLKEKLYYRLLWQVNDIAICPEHNILIHKKCWTCANEIPNVSNQTIIGFCPYCHTLMANAPIQHAEVTSYDKELTKNWEFLCSNKNPKFYSEEKVKNQQSIPMTLYYLIYLASTPIDPHLRELVHRTAINNRYTSFLHLRTIMNVLSSLRISMDDFFKIIVPKEFINELLQPKAKKTEKLSCIAPWCSSYLQQGTLIRTATTVKEYKDGQKYKYFMYCKICGTLYSLDQNNKLHERGYFISLAYDKVRGLLSSTHSIKDIAISLTIPIDIALRCVIFLCTNGLASFSIKKLHIPETCNPKTFMQVKNLIQSQCNLYEIKRILKLTYNEMLYYWFQSEIRIAKVTAIRSRTK